jgi:gliding motility-associated-like protein
MHRSPQPDNQRTNYLLTLTLSFLCLASSLKLQAQVPTFDWAVGIGGASATAIGETTFNDASGNVFVTGRFTGTMDFDPGAGTFNMTPIGAGSGDAFIVKLNATGNFLWAKQLGGSNITWGRDITADATGNIYVTGIFQGTIDFDPGAGTFNLTSAGSYDIFVVKLDPSANFLWAGKLGGVNQEDATAISVDASGNVLTTGSFTGPGAADFDPGTGVFNLTPPGLQGNAFISKLSPAGNFVFAVRFGNTQSLGSYALEIDAAGNIYTTGHFRNTVDFDPGAGTFNMTSVSAAQSDVFVSKLDSNGNFVWARKFSGSGLETGEGLALDAAGNVHVGGNFIETVDFDPGAGTFNITYTGTAFLSDAFIVKLDNNGNFIWAKSFGGSNSTDAIGSITVDKWGNVYSTGQYDEAVDFDPGPAVFTVTANSTDAFIHKLDAAGNFVSVQVIAGAGTQQGRGIHVNDAGNITTTGYYSTTTDFDPGAGTLNITSPGSQSFFVQRLTSVQTCSVPKPTITPSGSTSFCNGGSVNLSAPAGYTYLWSTGATTQQINVTTSASLSVTVTDAGGCSSPVSDATVVTLTGPCNQAPVIAAASASTTVGGTITLDLFPLISDPDNNIDLSTLTVLTAPASGVVVSLSNGTLTINYSSVEFEGQEQLTIRVCDLAGACADQVITLNVSGGELVIFNAISPNGDGLNDTWTIRNISTLSETKENKVFIYNRWGDEVFTVANYDNKINVFAGLSSQGKELTSGTYYYRIEFTSGKELLTGYIVLRR